VLGVGLVYTHDGAPYGGSLGFDAEGAGDVDGDGHADLLFGDADAYYLILGTATPTGEDMADADAVLTLAAGSFLDAAGAGDLDGDGFDDLLFGNGAADDAGVGAGRADVVMGSAAPASVDVESAAAASWLGDAALAEMGIAVAAAGDVDANGVPDLLIGQPGVEDGGAVTLILWRR
jgi:hypothetical protein